MKTVIRSTVFILVFTSLITPIIMTLGCGEPEIEERKEPETENTFLKLLKLIPKDIYKDINKDIGLGGIIEIKDYEKWRELNQIDIYKTDNERCNVEEYLERMLDAMDDGKFLAEHIFQTDDFYTGLNKYMLSTTIQDEYVGYDFVDVDAQVTVLTYGVDMMLTYGFEMMLAAIGNFSEKSTNDALSYQKGWKPLTKEKYGTENYGGLTIHSWGDGKEINMDITLSPPHADNIGRLRPLAVDDGFIFISNSVANVKKMIDAGTGKTASLLDMEGYVLAAEAMNDAGTYYAMFFSPEYMESENDNAEKPLGDTSVIGFGGGTDETGKYVILVNVCDDEDSAKKYDAIFENILDDPREIDLYNNETGEWEVKTLIFNNSILEKEKRIEGRVFIAKLYMEEEALKYFIPFHDRLVYTSEGYKLTR